MANRPLSTPITILIAAALLPGMAAAAESRTGVHPSHGEMVLLRDVNARHAYRPVPPSVALIVDPTPTRVLHQALGTGELSDADFAAISSGHSLGAAGPASTVQHTVGNALAAGLGTGTGAAKHGGAMSGDGFGGTMSGPLGTVGATTRGIGGHVTGALSQFPFGQKPGGP
ncbi:MAG: hypothetical protein ACTHZI_04030 [Luteimonas sp.]